MALAGEADNEIDAIPLEGSPLYHWLGYGPELGDEAGGSRPAAGTDEVGTYYYEPEGAVGLACGRSMKSLPAGGSCGEEQDCGGR